MPQYGYGVRVRVVCEKPITDLDVRTFVQDALDLYVRNNRLAGMSSLKMTVEPAPVERR